MKLTLGKHGWPVVVTEFDLNTATQNDINVLGCLINHYTLVVLKNQKLSVPTEEAVCKMFGETLDESYDKDNNNRWSKMKTMYGKVHERLAQPGGEITLRVTGEKNKNGDPGLFGSNDELKWHADAVWQEFRRSMIWLYGDKGTPGSITSFTNHIIAYNKMSNDFKNKLKDLKSVYKIVYHYAEREVFKKDYAISEVTFPLVYTNVGGQTGIFLSWLHLYHFVGMTVEDSVTIVNTVRDSILLDPECVYDHHWEDGDVLLMEQWLGLHKRHAFEHMDKRVLHRIETDFSKINFTKMADSLKLVTEKE